MTKVNTAAMPLDIDLEEFLEYLSREEWTTFSTCLDPLRRMEVMNRGIKFRVTVDGEVVYQGSNPADGVAAFNNAGKL